MIRNLPAFHMWFQVISFKDIARILVGAKPGTLRKPKWKATESRGRERSQRKLMLGT